MTFTGGNAAAPGQLARLLPLRGLTRSSSPKPPDNSPQRTDNVSMRLGKFPSATGDLRTDAVRELRWAMAGEGLTPDKLRVMEAVLELPVVADAIAGVPDSRRPTVAYGVVADAARALGASLPQQVLRTALAIDYEGQARNLTERRALYTSFRDAHTLYYIEQRMLEALVTALGGLSGVRRGSRPAPTAPTAATTAPGPRAWNVPLLRDPHFLGRDALLDAIHTELATSRTTALSHTITHTVSGLGGIGKTALAAEFAYRFASEYDVVWWVRSEEPTTLAGDYAALATPLGIAPGASQADTVRAVREWLQAHDRWLLVFDNAEHDEDIAALLPGLRGNVLVTSRSSQWTTVATVVDVPPLDERSAAELVLRRTGTSDLDAAARLARKLDGIPKLIDVAAGIFVRGAGVSLTRFANQLDDGAAATQGVWDAAFDRAVAAPGARAVLAACTALNPDDVSDQLLVHLTGLPDGTVDAAIGALRSQQILRAAADGLMLHRLVQRAVRDRLDTDERAAAARRASDLLLAANPVPEPAGFAAIRRLQTHAPYVAAALGDDERVAPLLTWYAECLRRDGAYPAARRIAEQAVANAESAAGDGALAAALGIQAVVLRDMGQLDAAHAVAERAVKLSETVHGPDHTDVAEQLHVLATIRCDLGDMHGARDAAARAVAIVSAARGPEHPDVGRPLEVLAWILRQENVASAIIGASRPEQIYSNVEASGVELSQDTLDAIDEALDGVTVTEPRRANFVGEGVKHR